MHFVTTNDLAWIGVLASLLLLAATLAAMRADSRFVRHRLETEVKNRRLWSRSLADASFDGLLIHRQGVILLMNRALVRLLGVREREWLGQNFATLARADEVSALRAELEAPQAETLQFRLIRANKAEIAVEISSQSIDFDGQPATVTALRDITQRLRDAEQIARLHHYDPLTNLPNRQFFAHIMAQAVSANDHHPGAVTLCLTDIDQFKAVNDQVGRAGGDFVLQQLAARLGAHLAPEDVLARLGNDKFAMLLTSAGPPNRGLSLAGQVLASCREPFVVEGQLVSLRLSVGVAMFPDHAADADQLLRAGEAALDHAVAQGGGGPYMFQHEETKLNAPSLPRGPSGETAQLRDELRAALGRGEIQLIYQPVFSLADLTLAGFEAQAIWQHPAHGLLGPERFMPIAEAAGLAHELSGQLIERACTEAVAAGAPRICVNLSAAQFRDVNLPARIAAILRRTGLPPAALELELAEALLLESRGGGMPLLHALQGTGARIALDEFGAGASSLNTLCNLPLNRLKIDPRFVRRLGQEQGAEAVVGAILTLAATLRLDITALGLESEAQLDFLRRHGCNSAQGPLLGAPGPRALAQSPQLSLAPLRPALVVSRE